MVLPIILDVGGIGDDLDEFVDPNVILNPVLDRADAAQIYASQVQNEALNAIQTIADSGVEAVSADLFTAPILVDTERGAGYICVMLVLSQRENNVFYLYASGRLPARTDAMSINAEIVEGAKLYSVTTSIAHLSVVRT